MTKLKSWEHRLAGAPDRLMVDFVESLSIDKRLYKYDIAGSIAHAQMLAQRKLITKSEFAKIKRGLARIEREIAEGKFKFDKAYEDIHMAIENALVKKIGSPAKKLHTAAAEMTRSLPICGSGCVTRLIQSKPKSPACKNRLPPKRPNIPRT
jgi:argininosuccinate lyase